MKGFPKEATADDLFVFFEEYGKVLECRIVADRYGYSKGMFHVILFVNALAFTEAANEAGFSNTCSILLKRAYF